VEFESHKQRGVAPIEWIKRRVQCPMRSMQHSNQYTRKRRSGLCRRGARVLDFPCIQSQLRHGLNSCEFIAADGLGTLETINGEPVPDFVLDPAAFY
jgi:hypothetical protein